MAQKHPEHKGHNSEKDSEKEKPRGGQAMAISERSSWTHAVSGWVMAFFIGIILTAFTGIIITGFGAATLSIQGLAITQGVVGIIIWFIAFFFGGLTAASLAGENGLAQGLMTWTVGLLFMIILLVLAGILDVNIALIGGVAAPAQNVASAVAIGTGVLLAVELVGALLGGWLGGKVSR